MNCYSVLNGETYRVVADLAGQTIVIVQRGRQWRVASTADAERILAGLHRPMLRVVS
jgi:hypothetical protein